MYANLCEHGRDAMGLLKLGKASERQGERARKVERAIERERERESKKEILIKGN